MAIAHLADEDRLRLRRHQLEHLRPDQPVVDHHVGQLQQAAARAGSEDRRRRARRRPGGPGPGAAGGVSGWSVMAAPLLRNEATLEGAHAAVNARTPSRRRCEQQRDLGELLDSAKHVAGVAADRRKASHAPQRRSAATALASQGRRAAAPSSSAISSAIARAPAAARAGCGRPACAARPSPRAWGRPSIAGGSSARDTAAGRDQRARHLGRPGQRGERAGARQQRQDERDHAIAADARIAHDLAACPRACARRRSRRRRRRAHPRAAHR